MLLHRARRFDPRRWPLSAQVIGALGITLLPLGGVAAFSAFENYRQVSGEQTAMATARLSGAAAAIEASLGTEFVMLQSMLLSERNTPDARQRCDLTLTRVAEADAQIASIVRIDSSGRLVCASAGARLPELRTTMLRPAAPTAWGRFARAVLIDESTLDRNLVLAVQDISTDGDGHTILAMVPRRLTKNFLPGGFVTTGETFELTRHSESLATWGGLTPALSMPQDGTARRIAGPSGGPILAGHRKLGIDGMTLTYARPAPAFGWQRALGIALPILMWLVALLIGWWTISRLVVTPLQRLRGVVERYGRGETGLRSGRQRNQEMAELGAAFDRMADDIGTHEDEQAAALATQKKLTREVHHRVKNNLQIVSSLISLQSRDAATPEVAYAYATIQKRVNALALVHRWLFDDEALRGVDLKSLTQDLCAGLEQSVGTSENTSVSIQPQVDRVYVGQDTAVPLAFLITELVTAAARQAKGPAVRVEVGAKREGDTAVLSVCSDSFVGDTDFTASATPEARIATGMARQMRSAVRFDPAAGRYSITFPAA